MRLLGAEGILQVEAVHPELVRVDHHAVVRDPPGHPVMAADGLQPPDFVFVVEGNPVGFIGAVPLQQLRQTQHTLPGAADIGQYKHDDVLFPDPPGDLLLPPVSGRPVSHQRVRCQDARIGGDGLGGRHADVGGIDAGGRPDAVLRVDTRAGGIAQRFFRKLNLQMGEDAFVFSRLILRFDHNQLLDIKMTVVRPGDHGGTVVAGILSDQHGGTGHRAVSSFLIFRKYSRFPGKVQDHRFFFG